MNFLKYSAVIGWWCLFCVSASAIEISVFPSAQEVQVGDLFSVDVNIAGLGDGVTPSISAFDIDVIFDATILSPGLVTFGTGLDVLGLGSFQGVSGVGPLNVFEVSLDFAEDLDLFQPSAFTLFSIDFNSLGSGATGIAIQLNALGDVDGLPLDATLIGGRVTVTGDTPSPVPLPGTIWLMAAALMWLGGRYVPRRSV